MLVENASAFGERMQVLRRLFCVLHNFNAYFIFALQTKKKYTVYRVLNATLKDCDFPN